MSFEIVVHPAERLATRDPEDTSVAEAVESVYRYAGRVTMRFAAGAEVQLGLEAEISDIYDDRSDVERREERRLSLHANVLVLESYGALVLRKIR